MRETSLFRRLLHLQGPLTNPKANGAKELCQTVAIHDTCVEEMPTIPKTESSLPECCSRFSALKAEMLAESDTGGVVDTECGPATMERVILTIKGLKCGCCETGIARAVQQLPAIRNSQVNIVLAKAEFDLDTSRLTVSKAISQLHRATGYTFEQYYQPNGQILDLLVADPTELHRAGRPYGVNRVDSGEKQFSGPVRLFSGRSSTIPKEKLHQNASPNSQNLCNETRVGVSLYQHSVRIHYDAKQIGARDVFEYYQELAPSQDLHLATPGAHESITISARQVKRAGILFFVTLVFTVPVLVFAWAPLNHQNQVYNHASLALATAVQLIATKEFAPGALKTLIHAHIFDMDLLVALSTTTAYIFSVISYAFEVKKRPLESGSFFETSTLLVTLLLLGRLVNEFARFRATKSVSIRSLQTEDALLITPGSSRGPGVEARKIDARLLQYGDRLKVPPHTRIVTDGQVIYGGSEVDESMITGESIPVAKGLGHSVYAGTTNGTGQLIVMLTKLPHENSISRIATLVENAELSKPRIQALADLIAGWFVPIIAVIGASVFIIWLFVERYRAHGSWRAAAIKAITHAIATLIVSCPCAIGLAVPMVILIAGGVSARFGIIFRDPQKLEVARNVTDIVFDKTGTLSTGKLVVVEGRFIGPQNADYTKRIIAGLLEGDKHPVATAVTEWLKMYSREENRGHITPMKFRCIVSEPGNGIKGICHETGLEARAGNPHWLGVEVLESPHTLLCVTVSGSLSAVFRLQDAERDGAETVVQLLLKRGINVHMVSGDSEGAVNKTAHTLNIPKCRTQWRHKPEDKQRYVHMLQKQGRVVLFCGDGTNDSVALKQADVGVHINHGSDVAKSAADVVLMTSRLYDILILLDISGAAYRRILLNFGWSALYNLVAILMAAGAFIKVTIEPAYAGLGELVSVLPVVLFAFQLKSRDYGRKYRLMERE